MRAVARLALRDVARALLFVVVRFDDVLRRVVDALRWAALRDVVREAALREVEPDPLLLERLVVRLAVVFLVVLLFVLPLAVVAMVTLSVTCLHLSSVRSIPEQAFVRTPV